MVNFQRPRRQEVRIGLIGTGDDLRKVKKFMGPRPSALVAKVLFRQRNDAPAESYFIALILLEEVRRRVAVDDFYQRGVATWACGVRGHSGIIPDACDMNRLCPTLALVRSEPSTNAAWDA